MLAIWLLLIAVAVAVIAVVVIPRFRKDPPRGSGPGPKRSAGDGPPTMGADPKGPPAP